MTPSENRVVEGNKIIAEIHKFDNCPEFPFFGATYPDAQCIDGYLWDLDSYDNGLLTKGGDDPCPFCNTEEFIEQHHELEEGVTINVIMKRIEYWYDRYYLQYDPQPDAKR